MVNITIFTVEWWNLYGNSTPHLQKLAIRISGLTTNAAGCERNWSVFEHVSIHNGILFFYFSLHY